MTTINNERDLYGLASQEDRSAPRQAVIIPATLRVSGAGTIKMTVIDLSLSGFGYRGASGIKPGTLCWLNLPGLQGQQAEVIWNNGQQVGCAFATLLNPAVLALIVSRHRAGC